MSSIHLAANRGDVGGGEVMMLRLADALMLCGYDVTVVAPTTPTDVARMARERGLAVVEIPARDRRSYALALRHWDRSRKGLLWCNGLLPALATAGHHDRLVHLHQEPLGVQRPLAVLARRGAVATVVPSEFMRARLAPAEVLPNWTDDLWTVAAARRERAEVAPDEGAGGDVVVGFLGRVGREKGTHLLAAACCLLPAAVRTRIRLLVAGDDRFVPEADRAVVADAFAAAVALGVRMERPGWVDPRTFLRDVDVAVFPSVRSESFGLVAAEAMAAGVPLVVSDAGALPEVVGPDYPYVVPRNDAPALATALGAAIAGLPAEELTAQMWRRWQDLYSPAAGQRAVVALMERLASLGAVNAPPSRLGEQA